MTGTFARPRHSDMEVRQISLSEHRARTERRRGFMIIAATTLFAIVARVLMF